MSVTNGLARAVAALGDVPMFLVLVDMAGLILWVNRYDYGLGPKDVIGKNVAALISDEDAERLLVDVAAVIGGGEARQGTIRGIRIDVPSPALGYRMSAAHDGDDIIGVWLVGWEARPMDVATDQYVLGPTGAQVVRHLMTNGPRKASAIGNALGDVIADGHAGQRMRGTLTSLVERGIILHTADGYVLSPAFAPIAERLLK